MIQVRLPPSIFWSVMFLFTPVAPRTLERDAGSQPGILADASSASSKHGRP
jgi:predicted secreted protein